MHSSTGTEKGYTLTTIIFKCLIEKEALRYTIAKCSLFVDVYLEAGNGLLNMCYVFNMCCCLFVVFF